MTPQREARGRPGVAPVDACHVGRCRIPLPPPPGPRTHHVSLDCRPSMPMCPNEARTSCIDPCRRMLDRNPRRPPWRVPRAVDLLCSELEDRQVRGAGLGDEVGVPRPGRSGVSDALLEGLPLRADAAVEDVEELGEAVHM